MSSGSLHRRLLTQRSCNRQNRRPAPRVRNLYFKESSWVASPGRIPKCVLSIGTECFEKREGTRKGLRACVRACSCREGILPKCSADMLKLSRLAHAYELHEFDSLRIQKKQVSNARPAPFSPFVSFSVSFAFSYGAARDIIHSMDRSRSQSPRRPGRGSASDRHSGGFGGDNYFDWSTSFDHEDGKNESICMQWVIPSRNFYSIFRACFLGGKRDLHKLTLLLLCLVLFSRLPARTRVSSHGANPGPPRSRRVLRSGARRELPPRRTTRPFVFV